LALAVAAALAAALPSAAESGTPAPATEVLPDLRQVIPAGIGISLIDGAWRLGFDSKVYNDGPGYLRIRGTGPGDETMVADQIIQMSDGTTTTVQAVGDMRYVRSAPGATFPHNHFHFLDFERYELRLPDSDQTLVKDEKTGFCLADAFTPDHCGRDKPGLTSVEEGIAVTGSDMYSRNVEGQYITLDPATVPAGDYLLVHRVNPTGAFAEANPANDAASVRLQVNWSADGTPSATVTNRCAATVTCPAPPPSAEPPPTPEAHPQQQPVADPEPVTAATPLPAPVPILSRAEFTRPPEQATMSREMAGRLVRSAIQKSVKEEPKNVRTKCARLHRDTFACSASWMGSGSATWTGKVRVWYRLKNANLSWFYDLSATRRPGGKRVVARGARGSASSTRFIGAAAASMVCGLVDFG
jgi:hypothetical protein